MKEQIKKFLILIFLLAIPANIYLFIRAKKLQSSPLVDKRDEWESKIIIKQNGFHPQRLAICNEDTIYATDKKLGCVWMWKSNQGLKRIKNALKNPTSIAANDAGEIWVINHSGQEIFRITSNGSLKTLSKPDSIKSIHDLAFDSYHRYFLILDRSGQKIFSVNSSAQWKMVRSTSLLSFGKGFGRAYALTAGEEGKLYVLDFENCIMTIFPDGTGTKSAPKKKGVFTWGMIGDIAYHPTIGLVIADNRNKRILRMTVSDHIFETISDWRSGISNPTGVAISSDGTIYICDPKAGVIASLRQKKEDE